jgi:hypothetical protein
LAIPLPNLCLGDSLPLSLAPNYTSYLWNTGDTIATIYAKQSDNFYATVENQFGCIATSDTLALQFNPLPAQPNVAKAGDILSIPSNGSYQWFFNNVRINGGINSSVLAQASGSYFCILTDNNGCSINSDTVNIIVTGMNEQQVQRLSIHPNPSKGEVTITTKDNLHIDKIELFDVTGKLVWEEKIQQRGQQIKLNLSLIPKGIYFLRAHSSKETIQKKLLIE